LLVPPDEWIVAGQVEVVSDEHQRARCQVWNHGACGIGEHDDFAAKLCQQPDTEYDAFRRVPFVAM
jgi:hypothetical protein